MDCPTCYGAKVIYYRVWGNQPPGTPEEVMCICPECVGTGYLWDWEEGCSVDNPYPVEENIHADRDGR